MSLPVWRLNCELLRQPVLVVRCDNEKVESFQWAKSHCMELLQVTAQEVDDGELHEADAVARGIESVLSCSHLASCPNVKLRVRDLVVVGIGSNKRKYTRAAYLGLVLAASLQTPKSASQPSDELHSEVLATRDAPYLCAVGVPAQLAPGVDHTRRSLPHQSLQASANMPVPLLPEDVERLEQGSQVLHRKDGHAKLREFREQLQDTLRNMVAPEILEDWTDREWPWQKFIAGLSEKVRDTVVGDGVKRFGIRVQRNILCPYTGEPQVNFLITRLNDTRVIHHPHQDRDEPLRFEFADGRPIDHPARDRHAEIRAFRLATEWSTRNRWPACVPNAFQTVLRCFKAERRPDGWQDDDFYFAHELSSFKLSRALQADFLQWLSNQFGRPWTQDIAEAESRSRQRSRSPMASRQHARDDVPPPCYPEDMAWWLTPPHRHPKRFTSVQVHWLKDAVKQHCAYDFRRHLDPYCELNLGGETWTSPAKPCTLDPEWTDAEGSCRFLVQDTKEQCLTMRLYSQDWFFKHDGFLGGQMLKVKDLIEQGEVDAELVSLDDKDIDVSNGTPRVKLRVQWSELLLDEENTRNQLSTRLLSEDGGVSMGFWSCPSFVLFIGVDCCYLPDAGDKPLKESSCQVEIECENSGFEAIYNRSKRKVGSYNSGSQMEDWQEEPTGASAAAVAAAAAAARGQGQQEETLATTVAEAAATTTSPVAETSVKSAASDVVDAARSEEEVGDAVASVVEMAGVEAPELPQVSEVQGPAPSPRRSRKEGGARSAAGQTAHFQRSVTHMLRGDPNEAKVKFKVRKGGVLTGSFVGEAEFSVSRLLALPANTETATLYLGPRDQKQEDKDSDEGEKPQAPRLKVLLQMRSTRREAADASLEGASTDAVHQACASGHGD
eukprot:TRINITY_DN29830_c0_g1_i6.p1 TRINITY_DN29830_c0_g1~~TRINITY_DN29830_c0_g1_i6.p1  ORF type:complete len:893 (-),score=152.53 TRINITY_DN29830_c0_g1_i6:203-2881(-)